MKRFMPVRETNSAPGNPLADPQKPTFETLQHPKKISKTTRSKKSATNFLTATYNMVEVR